MAYDLKKKLVIAISSRALFDLENENKMFEKKGLKKYYKYQIKNENKLLKRGAAYDHLVRQIL